jgi:hypothetical protein
VPVSETVCGLLLAPSFTYIVAVRAPVAAGVKVTEIVHLPFEGTLTPHVFVVEAKSLGSAPWNVIVPIVSAVGRLLIRVTFFAALAVPTFCGAKGREAGEIVTGAMPVPVSETVWGLFEALSTTVSVPVREPVAVGVNVTLMVHLPLIGTLGTHVFVSAKSPLAAMLVTVKAELRLLVKVTALAALVLPSA